MALPALKITDAEGNNYLGVGFVGDSAYQIAVKHGYEGTEEEWIASLQGYVLTDQDKQDIADLIDVSGGEVAEQQLIPNYTVFDITNRGCYKKYTTTEEAIKYLKMGYMIYNDSLTTKITITSTEVPEWSDIACYKMNSGKWTVYSHQNKVEISGYMYAVFITPTCYVTGTITNIKQFFARTFYDNSKSGLTATEVQDAIDELASRPGGSGEAGADGKSAYQIAVDNGFVGTETEWLASLKGPKGDQGEDSNHWFVSTDARPTGWKPGDLVLNPTTGDIYQITDSVSRLYKGNIKGPKGDAGTNGTNYTITSSDYSAIADVVLSKMTNASVVKY